MVIDERRHRFLTKKKKMMILDERSSFVRMGLKMVHSSLQRVIAKKERNWFVEKRFLSYYYYYFGVSVRNWRDWDGLLHSYKGDHLEEGES